MDRGVSSLNIGFALNDRDWPKAKQLLEQVKGGEIGGENDGNFGYATVPVPAGGYSILLARVQGKRPDTNPRFAEAREQLSQKVRAAPGNGLPVRALGIV